ncbi:MAG: hypothetical protein JXM73_13955 [Anaerolineae bacterium]|nr:hypothetical protein [Anaerolineae bacterium]
MTLFSNLPNLFGKKPEVDPVQQQHQTSEQRSLTHYKTWPVFLVYRKRQIEQILQAVGDKSPLPTPADAGPNLITPDQLLAQIQAGADADRPAAENTAPRLADMAAPEPEDATNEETLTDDLVTRIEAATRPDPEQEVAGAPPEDNPEISFADLSALDVHGLVEPLPAFQAEANSDSSNVSNTDLPDGEAPADSQTQSPDDGVLAAFEAIDASCVSDAAPSREPDIDDLIDQLVATSEVS